MITEMTFRVKFKLGINRKLHIADMVLPCEWSTIYNRYVPKSFEAFECATQKISLLFNPNVIVKIKAILWDF